MKKYATEVLTFGVSSTKFKEQFQLLLDDYSEQGWVLNNYRVVKDFILVIVFEKDVEIDI